MTFGQSLPDGVPLVSAHISQGLALLQECRELVKERALIEREYSRSLDALYRKHAVKLDKKVRDLSLGTSASPSFATGEQGLVSSSMALWTGMLTSLEVVAKERNGLADRMISEVSDKMKSAIGQLDGSRKLHLAFTAKMAADVEKVHQDKDKARIKYLQMCEDVEAAKMRFEKADEKKQEQLKKAWHQSIVEMNNAKNTYLLLVSVCNVTKKHHQTHQLPWILDELEFVELNRIQAFKRIAHQYITCEQDTLKACSDHLSQLEQTALKGTTLWRDSGNMVGDDASKVVLGNHRTKLKTKLAELQAQLDKEQKRQEGLKKMTELYTKEPRLGDSVTTREELVENQRQVHVIEAAIQRCLVEIQLVDQTIGEDTDGGKAHAFKPASFKLPTPCGFCNEKMWGRQSLVCKDCGFACHIKCELKVTPTCSGTKSGSTGDQSAAAVSFSTSSASLSSQSTTIDRSGASGAASKRTSTVDTTSSSATSSATSSPSKNLLNIDIGGSMHFGFDSSDTSSTLAAVSPTTVTKVSDECVDPVSPTAASSSASGTKSLTAMLALGKLSSRSTATGGSRKDLHSHAEESAATASFTAADTQRTQSKSTIPRNANLTTLAIALYDYTPTSDSELALSKGQVISNVQAGQPLAQVVYAYEAQAEDELHVLEGDVVHVLPIPGMVGCR
ncbi:hypothetical protein BCR44DRAFT_1509213 [Catenaria anguillulae PL171]|uniref:Phorbol-ester/DAG-type domain-containing protein n=1 Tax=Catenaria anguillulae PL171 TaxID=765915 RepID=A0A1Y2I249_9FUNG|nr:hypothetical protein BCR44DRAFT_1509213 [Catenaria anguillulae PL171]